MAGETSIRSILRRQFIIAVGLSLLLGLGWGVGAIATSRIFPEEFTTTLQALFIVLTAFQGLFLFIMNCLRSTDAHKEWARWISVATCHKIEMMAGSKNMARYMPNGELPKDSSGGTVLTNMGDTMKGDTMKGDTMKGDTMKVDTMKGNATREDGNTLSSEL